jgi:spore maturation protein CgeB
MKIIVNYRNFAPIREAFEQCGVTVLENLWQPSDEQLKDCAGYLLCMYDAMKRPLETLRLKARLRARRIPLIGWNRDAPWHKGARRHRLWWFRRLRVLDIYCAHSLQDAESFSRNIVYLPNAAWTSQYHLGAATLEQMRAPDFYRYDVSFVGNLNAGKFPEFADRARFFRELEARLIRLGIRTRFQHSQGMTPSQQVALVQRSRINLNYGAACDDGPAKSWGLPERCYGVSACGGFLMSDARAHAADDFACDREWVDFADLDECVEKVRYYMNDLSAARDIAERAYHRVMRDHTYEQRARTLLAAIQAWQSNTLEQRARKSA